MEYLSPSKARQILDRVDLLSKIREDILSHPHLEERLLLCQPSADTPEWWHVGKHDKELLLGAAKHGLGRTDITILNDPDFSFHKILGKSIYNSVQAAKNLEKVEKAIKLENRDDILKFDKDEILVKLEKGEGTLKIEKVGIKKDKDTQATEKKPEVLNSDKGQVEMTLVKSETFAESKLENIAANNGLTITTVKAKSPEKEISKDEKSEIEKTVTEPVKEEDEEQKEKPSEEMEVSPPIDKENQEENEKKSKDEDVEKIPEVAEKIETKEEEETITEKEENKSEANDEKEKKENEQEVEKSPVVDMEISKDEATEKEKESEEEKEKEEEKEQAEITEEKIKLETSEETQKEKSEEVTKKTEEEEKGKEGKPEEEKTEERKEEEEVKEEETKTEEQKEVEPSKDPKVEDKCSVQAAELKAMFPDLEVIQPLSRLTQIDTFVLRDKAIDYNEPTVAQLLAHSYQSSIKWPKEHAIEARLRHIVHAVDQKEWPVTVNYTAGDENEPTANEKIDSDVITITTDHGISRSLAAVNNIAAAAAAAKKRKRHIAIDVETERAKLHALLNSSHMTSQPPVPLTKPPILSAQNWETNDESQSEESRRSTPVQPPPAHQQTRTPAIPFDLKYTLPGKTTVIPGTSSTLTPIDLSAG